MKAAETYISSALEDHWTIVSNANPCYDLISGGDCLGQIDAYSGLSQNAKTICDSSVRAD